MTDVFTVDGGSWHTQAQPGGDRAYPDFLLSEQEVTGVKGSLASKKSKL